MKPHPKIPKFKQNPVTSKTPKKAYSEDFYSLNPAWRLGLIELVEPFGWHELKSEQVHYVRTKLSFFESMTWSEILMKAKKQNHLVSVGDICKDARERLTAIKQDDIDELISLHLSGAERVWGILEHNVVKILWWDPNHQVCPSLLRHT